MVSICSVNNLFEVLYLKERFFLFVIFNIYRINFWGVYSNVVLYLGQKNFLDLCIGIKKSGLKIVNIVLQDIYILVYYMK